ncbi:hypothetical protein H4582DRAFT_2061728 [Lactarius indigo]|nr:hypothetical protein H4582DRAFT_2061728 [Lactarius indigo]
MSLSVKAKKLRTTHQADMQQERGPREKIDLLRSEVNAAHTVSHAASSSKKHVEPVRKPKGLKRCDAFVMGGFSTDWKAKVKHTPAPSMASSRANAEKGKNGPVSGAFYIDEPEALERAKATGSNQQGSRQVASVGSSGSSSLQATAEVEIKLKRASSMITGRSTPLPEGDRKRQHKQRYTVVDLPFPGGSRDVHTWRKTFLPLLHGWAGTQADPFGANCQMEGQIVNIWKRAFPSVALDQHDREIVLNVCDNVLNNWRSDIGKAGYHAVSVLWKQESTWFSSAKDIREYVSDAFVGLSFVYKFPERTNGRGPFCSDLISKVYASHLRKTSPDGGEYGPQIGGLALATVAVERGLTLFETGEDILKLDNNDGRGATHVRGYRFTDKVWGSRARAVVMSTQWLKDSNWVEIQDHASVYLQGTDHDEENGEDSGYVKARAMSLHAQIEIDCVLDIEAILKARVTLLTCTTLEFVIIALPQTLVTNGSSASTAKVRGIWSEERRARMAADEGAPSIALSQEQPIERINTVDYDEPVPLDEPQLGEEESDKRKARKALYEER